MSVYFIFGTYVQELYLPDIGTYSVFNGTSYMITEKVTEFENNACYPTITFIENNLHLAKSFQPISSIYFDYDIESVGSDDIYLNLDGLMSLSMIDHRLTLKNSQRMRLSN